MICLRNCIVTPIKLYLLFPDSMPMYVAAMVLFSNLGRAKISTLKSSNPKMADRVIYELLFSLTASPEICQAGGTTKTRADSAI